MLQHGAPEHIQRFYRMNYTWEMGETYPPWGGGGVWSLVLPKHQKITELYSSCYCIMVTKLSGRKDFPVYMSRLEICITSLKVAEKKKLLLIEIKLPTLSKT